MSIRDRMAALLAIDREDLPILRANASDPAKDRKGGSTSSLEGAIRFIGVAEFVVAGDVDSFRRHLSEAAKLRLLLCERALAGEPIDPSHVSVMIYKEVFDALAAGDLATAEALARHIGRRPEYDENHTHPFAQCLGYALMAFVLELPDQMAKRAEEFAELCRDPELCQDPERANFAGADFVGYATTFRGLLHRNVELAQDGLSEIVQGHKNQTKRGGLFHSSGDEVICVWGVGMANLACS